MKRDRWTYPPTKSQKGKARGAWVEEGEERHGGGVGGGAEHYGTVKKNIGSRDCVSG